DLLRMAAVFGGMQSLMAGIGWAGGVGIERAIASWDHWVAFGLLLLIGGRMIREGLRHEAAEEKVSSSVTLPQLAVLGVATSIDSAAVGVTLPMIGVSFVTALVVIGATSFLLSLIAGVLANRLASRFAERLEVAGGLVLVAIGVKILLEHTTG
ncbi:MAG TPA: manganese efflux pump MntP family protein, partial [Thermoanaerobaculia bacterium]|nr:manganese efflux pump MntP family protein [Thermoanaerobaculia bacterium]